MSAGLHLTEAQADRLQTVADRLKFVPDAVHVSATTYKAPGRRFRAWAPVFSVGLYRSRTNQAFAATESEAVDNLLAKLEFLP
jgi:hypothetical protein